MDRRQRRRLTVASIAAAAVIIAGAVLVSGWLRPAETGETSLDRLGNYGQVPPFTLTDRGGRQITRDDLRGSVWVADFIYTECTETCPTQSLQFARLQNDFKTAPDFRLVSITVDPQHDTPAVLTRYTERYGADPQRWFFLTGDKRAIYCLAKDGFHLSVVDQADSNPPPCGKTARLTDTLERVVAPAPAFATHGSKSLLMHSARLVLVDRTGRIRAYHLATDADSLARLRPNVTALLAERGRR